jgi:HPt (histidine-containing phosphotransfer) domain-containing protein
MNSNGLNEERITDLSYLASLCDDDREFKKEMIETFLKNTPPLIEEMKDLLKISEWKKIGDIAHKIKPSITFMGIHSAKDLILDLERNGRQQEGTTEIPSMVTQLEDICSKAFVELNAEMRDL